jgi:acyl-CoA thioester hydrolase
MEGKMPAIFEFTFPVADDEIDGLGHVNNVSYVRWMQDAAVAHSAAQGWDTDRYASQDCGFVARSHFIEYLQPAHAEETVTIETWVADMEKVTSLRRYRILRPADATLLAVAETKWAFLTLSTRRPRRIPPELRDAFEVLPGHGIHDPD